MMHSIFPPVYSLKADLHCALSDALSGCFGQYGDRSDVITTIDVIQGV